MARKRIRRNARPKQTADGEIEKRSASTRTRNKQKKSFWQRLVKALPLIVLALLFTFLLNRAGLFSELERMFLDIQMRTSMPAEDSNVVIVDIDKSDLAQVFGGQRSPLQPEAFERLIDAVAGGEPCAVGVDIDTGFEQFGRFRAKPLGNFVWVRDFRSGENISMQPVLGADELPSTAKTPIRWGLPRTIAERGITRYYTRSIKTTDGIAPSFSWSILETARERCPGIKFPELQANDDMLTIGFSRGAYGEGRIRVPASHIIKFADGGWENKGLLKDKIVLVSGSFVTEDTRMTPLGMMDGFAINANIIETELRGGGVKPPGIVTLILLLAFDSVLLMALFHLFPWRKAALLSLPFIIVLSFACSFFTYWSFSHWAFFAPVMLGVLATEMFDKAKDFFKKRYKEEIAEAYGEIIGPAGGKEDGKTID